MIGRMWQRKKKERYKKEDWWKERMAKAGKDAKEDKELQREGLVQEGRQVE
jgi:hypothetical protein